MSPLSQHHGGRRMIPKTFDSMKPSQFHDWLAQRALAICNAVRDGKLVDAVGMLKSDLGSELACTLTARVLAHLETAQATALRLAIEQSTGKAHASARAKFLRDVRALNRGSK